MALRPAPLCSPRSSLWLIRGFVASIYFWAGIYKLRADWFDGRTFLLFHHRAGLDGPVADWLLGSQSLLPVMAISVAILELLLGPLLLWSRTRCVALFVAYAFHAGLEVVAHPDMLGWGMMALLACFWGTGASNEE